LSFFLIQVFGQPDGLTLVQVQLIFRHGARTPYGDIPNNYAVWNCTLDMLEIPYNGEVSQVTLPRIFRKNYILGEEGILGNCAQGELTINGYYEHVNLGAQLRKTYIDKFHLLDEEFNPEQIYIRSTDIERTFQSAEAHMHGFYPPPTRKSSGTNVIDIFTVEQSVEYLTPMANCPAFMQSCNAVQNTSLWAKKMQEYNPLMQQLENVWNSTAFPWWIGLFGILESRIFNGIAFPPGVDQQVYEDIEALCCWQIQQLYGNPEYMPLGIGLFIQEIRNNIIDLIYEGETDPRYFIYSAHDTSVAFVAIALGIFSGEAWPPYASNLAIELYSAQNDSFFIRVLYQQEPMQVPGCENVYCTLNEFLTILHARIPTNWDAECQVESSRKTINQMGVKKTYLPNNFGGMDKHLFIAKIF